MPHEPIFRSNKAGHSARLMMETKMKHLILAAFAVLALGAGVANAAGIAHEAPRGPAAQYNFQGGDGA